MSNKKAALFYSNLSAKIKDSIETRNKSYDTTEYDVKLILKYSSPSKNLLDLGSGTGLIINSIYKNFNKVFAVEREPGLSRFIKADQKIIIKNCDIMQLEQANLPNFELITIFGVMNYFTKEEALMIYKSCFKLLNSNGKIIIKNQMGLDKNVNIDGWSDELQTNYFSQYRTLSNEKILIQEAGLRIIDVVEPYPAHFNRWNNTRFQAIVAGK